MAKLTGNMSTPYGPPKEQKVSDGNVVNIRTNAELPANWRSQFAQSVSGGYYGADTLHNVWLDYGYPDVLTFSNFWNMYRRNGIARSIIEKPVDVCWMTMPDVEANDRLENEIDELDSRLKLWQRLKGLDTRQRVGRYAGLFMRVADGKQPNEPLEGTLPSASALVQIVPLYEGQLKVLSTDTNPTSMNFGLPTMYQYDGAGSGNRNEQQASSFEIHPSRVIIAAEGADNGGIYGIPALEAPFNALMDLVKIIGAGGEGFYRNAAQTIVYALKDTANASSVASLLEDFNDQADDLMKNRMRRSLIAPGMDPNVLQSTMTDPTKPFANALNDVSAACGIPATILIGQQTGRLASTEDSKHMLSLGNSRRENFLTDMIESVFDWCQKHGVLTDGDIKIEWDDLLEQSDEERLANAEKMAMVNERQYKSGEPVVFGSEEIREQAGYDEMEDIDMDGESEELPDDVDFMEDE